MLKVTEIFKSIQGEGTRAGLPCTFIRLSGCSLRCAWCDTQYAWEEGTLQSIETILAQVNKLGCKLVEITGGEPLEQDETPMLARALLDMGYTVLIETNGACDIGQLPSKVVRIMDIKPPSSGVADKLLLSNLKRLAPTDEIKCIIADKADFDWALDIVRTHRLSEQCPVIMSPAWNRLEPKDLAQWILDANITIRLGLQMHKYIWDPTARGV